MRGLWFIRHVAAGLTYRCAPQPDDHYAVQLVPLETLRSPAIDSPEIGALGLAGRVAALFAGLIIGFRGHKGAVYFRYRPARQPDPYYDPETTDAPPIIGNAPA
jgi:hypothetical protein